MQASHRLGYRQRQSLGTVFWTHPDAPGIAFPTRKAALKAAGQSATHSYRGHLLTGENLYLRPDTGTRQCMTCKKAHFKDWYAKNGKEKNAKDA